MLQGDVLGPKHWLHFKLPAWSPNFSLVLFSTTVVQGVALNEPERDRLEREISEWDFFREDDVVVPVFADEGRGAVWPDGKRQALDAFRSDAGIVGLNQRDLVQKPETAAGFSDMMRLR